MWASLGFCLAKWQDSKKGTPRKGKAEVQGNYMVWPQKLHHVTCGIVTDCPDSGGGNIYPFLSGRSVKGHEGRVIIPTVSSAKSSLPH